MKKVFLYFVIFTSLYGSCWVEFEKNGIDTNIYCDTPQAAEIMEFLNSKGFPSEDLAREAQE